MGRIGATNCAAVIDVDRTRCGAHERLIRPSIKFVTLVEPGPVSRSPVG
jgi:hypothetical protein